MPKKYENEPTHMCGHDYRELYEFLLEQGVPSWRIKKTGIGAWRQAKALGFVESDQWNYIPGRGHLEDLNDKLDPEYDLNGYYFKIAFVILFFVFLIIALCNN